MSTSSSTSIAAAEDRIGGAIAARLSQGAAALPHDIGERLRVARAQALVLQKREHAPAVFVGTGGQASAGAPGWWSWLASALPLVALVAGLVTIAQWRADDRAAEIAEVDAALLTDDLPTAAYTDPGFTQFLKINRVQQ